MHTKDKKEILYNENNLKEQQQIIFKIIKDNGKFQVLSQIPQLFFFNTILKSITIEYSRSESVFGMDSIYMFI